jgi:mannose-1-phosphate guanylyltransferase
MKTTEPIQAVILVGGEGTRLRPLTYTTVKAMVPVLNKPYIEHLFEHLNKHNIKEIVLAMGYKPNSIKEYFKKKAGVATKLIYSLEQNPLGTAGAVKNAAQFINKDKPFFVINGDIFSGLNFSDMLRFHNKKKAKVTIALTPVDDPTRFGVVDVDDNLRIRHFIEKPKREDAPSNLINAGTYILDPEILEFIPKDRKFMFEHDVFPKLILDNVPVFGYPTDSYWIDIGTLENYLKLNFDLLLGNFGLKKKINKKNAIHKSSAIHPDLKVTGSVVIDAKCTIGQDVHLVGPVIIGSNSIVDHGVNIQNSILWSSVHVGENTVIKNCIIGSNVCIESGTVLENRVVGKDGISQNMIADLGFNKGG